MSNPSFEFRPENLPEITWETVYVGLQVKTNEAHQEYLTAHQPSNRNLTSIKHAILMEGALAMARKSFDKPRGKKFELTAARGYMTDAQLSIARFAYEDMPNREFLLSTVFFKFEKYPGLKFQIGRMISAAVVPAGDYSNYEFAAGYAVGLLTAEPK